MPTTMEVWDAFAGILSYPAGNGERVQTEWAPSILSRFPALASRIAPLVAYNSSSAEGDREELFTQTFDGNAERALELGWHLHGENYARGVLLVRLRSMLRDRGLEEGSELPDHVSNVLRLLGRVDAVTARGLVDQLLAPALEKVIAGFGEEENPYRQVLVGLKQALAPEPPTRNAS